MGKPSLLVLLFVTACGGGTDLVGTYSVTHHTENTTSCTAEGEAQTDVAFFRFAEEDFFGQDFLQLSLCGDATEASCSSAGLYLFAEDIDNGSRARFSSSSGGGDFGDCYLSFGLADAVRTEDSVRVDMWKYSEEVPGLTEEQCSTDEAESRGDSMPCESYEVVEGDLVPEENP
jgi:hypothetical protein